MSVEVIVRIVSVCWFVYNLFMGYITGVSEKKTVILSTYLDILVDLVKNSGPLVASPMSGDPGNPPESRHESMADLIHAIFRGCAVFWRKRKQQKLSIQKKKTRILSFWCIISRT